MAPAIITAATTLRAQQKADSNETLRIGLIGCGGRGTGAASQALQADYNARLVAVADDILGRNGRMVDAIAAIGRGADAFEGTPFHLKVD